MKTSSNKDYKALYEQSQLRCQEQEKIVAILQGNLQACGTQQTVFIREMNKNARVLAQQQKELSELRATLVIKDTTIQGQEQRLNQQATLIAEQHARLDKAQKEVDDLYKKVSSLNLAKEELKLVKKWIFGIRSERYIPNADVTASNAAIGQQLTLAVGAEQEGAVCEVTGTRNIPAKVVPIKRITQYARRSPLPADLPEEIVPVGPQSPPEGYKLLRYEDHRQLACRGGFGFYILAERRAVFITIEPNEKGKHQQMMAPLPSHPIPRCKVDVTFLAMLVINKFLYHLPIDRQQRMFRMHGIKLKYNTLCNWSNRVAEILEPLYAVLLREMLIAGYMLVDETRYRVLDLTKKKKGKKSHMGYLWGMSNPIQRIVLYTYQRGRGKKDIRPILASFKGYLQTDGYGVYTDFGRQEGVTHLECHSHTRRYFFDARDNDKARATYVMEQIYAPLYEIEKRCREDHLSFDERGVVRQKEAVPILNEFHNWLVAEQPKLTPRSRISTAVNYALNRWDHLMVYTTDGMLELDTNFMEREIRPITLGRRNYLFAGSDRAAELYAVHYSLLNTCVLQGINPQHWLDDVLRRITAHPKDRLRELLPQFWKPASAEKQKTA